MMPLMPFNSIECIIKVDMSLKGEIIDLWLFLWSVLVQSAVIRK